MALSHCPIRELVALGARRGFMSIWMEWNGQTRRGQATILVFLGTQLLLHSINTHALTHGTQLQQSERCSECSNVSLLVIVHDHISVSQAAEPLDYLI
jgi:hypothetical protein